MSDLHVDIEALKCIATILAQDMWQLPDDQFVRQFPTLPRIVALKSQNPFPREDRVVFHERDHTYLLDGVTVPRSVTGLIHGFSSPFDPARAVRCMKQGRNWDEKRAEMEAQRLGTTDDEIMSRWRRNGEAQSKRGQLLHHHAECILNNVQIEEPHSPEFLQLRSIYRSLLLLGLTPHRTELCIFHVGLRLAGQIDALFLDRDWKLVIVDWKRIRDLKYENIHGSLHYPLDHLPDTNYWTYALQLNMYRYILETEYGLDVSRMMLAVVHPQAGLPRLVDVPRLDAESQAIHDFEIEHGRADVSSARMDTAFSV